MSAIDSIGVAWGPRVLSVLRFVTGFLYFWHGTQKAFGFPMAPNAAYQALDWMTLRGASAGLELVGGALLMLGLFSRPVAFILSGHMAFAYFIAHAPQGFWPIVNRGETAILFCFVFLYIAAAGPGPWSIDAARRRA